MRFEAFTSVLAAILAPATKRLDHNRARPRPRPQPRQRRKLTGLLFAMVSIATLSLTACVSVPDSGPVREGLGRLDQVERGVQFTPPGPQAGSDQDEIVRGFVRAASSNLNDYEVAREFLAPTYAEQWDPSLGVLIDEGTQQIQVSEDNIATLALRVVANVDEGGTLTLSEPGRTTEVQFELTQVGGEWRILSAPAGIILDRSTFTTVWTPRSIYYLSADQRLVPDLRWFLNSRSTLSTQIMRELLQGPSVQMEQALHTAFPEGTALSTEAVPVIDGTAVINLTPELFEADDTAMDLLKRQISLSLPSTVTGFQLSVHGTVVEGGIVSSTDDIASGEIQYTGVMKDGHFGTVVSGEIEPIPGLSERIDELSPHAITLSPNHSAAAVLYDGGVAWVRDQEIVVIDSRSGLLVPSFDALGYVWTFGPSRPNVIEVSRADGFEVMLDTPWLEGRKTVAVRVSMGGNRIAALVEDGEGSSEVLVAGIVRDDLGQPTGFTDVTTQLWVQGAPRDLDWIGDTRFAALTESGLLGSSARVTLGMVGNFSSDAGAVAGGATVSGGSRSLLRVLDDQHRLFAPQGVTGWQLQQSDIDLVAKIG